jgi:APA family basic amino acid/polyamine antiporter
MTNIACIIFVLCAGFPQASTANLAPFLPYGVRGIFSAASMVFFAFVGFDYVANAAEEVRLGTFPGSRSSLRTV